MLNEAGYGTNDDVYEEPTQPRELANSPYPFSEFDIGAYIYGTNNTVSVIPTPGLFREVNGNPLLIGTNSVSIFRCAMWAFEQIQIRPMPGEDNHYLKPGEFGIFVPSKTH
ncbi:MAG: hypothetical protein WBN22_10210 [Verrucomicrobiia bacterium]